LDVTAPRWACCLLRQAATAFAFIFAAVPALGQETQVGNEKPRLGSIHGTLTTTQEDTSSGLAGISVNLTTEPPDGNPMTADTDGAGHYEFKDLKPGTYTISITQAGFKPFTKSLSLSAGEAAVADIRVELQTVTEKVEVSEATQSIATEDVTAPSVELTQRQLISLPTAQEKIREVLPVTPGVVKTQDGKLNFKGATRIKAYC
jgi:Carboxypeptidase regulatory-like domain